MPSMPRDWNPDVVSRYIDTPPSERTEHVFHRTHLDIDEIYAEYLYPNGFVDEFITQESVLSAITDSNLDDDNRLFLLEGVTGCGKSQLSTWIAHQVGENIATGQRNSRVAIHISRNQRTPDAIFKALTKHVAIDHHVSSIDELDPEALAETCIAYIRGFAQSRLDVFSESEIRNLTEAQSGKLDLRDILEENIRKYQDGLSDEPIPAIELIDRDEFSEITSDMLEESRVQEGFEQLRHELHKYLVQILGVEDVQEQLRKISRAYVDAGFRPILIIEDFPTIGPLQQEFLNFAVQPAGGYFDIILGLPTGWYKQGLGTKGREGLRTYVKDNARGYLQLSDSSGNPYFFTEGFAVSMAERYLHAIRTDSDGTLQVDLPEPIFNNLYPFNKAALRHIYSNLQRSGRKTQTPRLFLYVIRDCLLNMSPPFEVLDRNQHLTPLVTPITEDYTPSVERLVRWYGDVTKERVTLSKSLFNIFDVEIPPRMYEDESIALKS